MNINGLSCKNCTTSLGEKKYLQPPHRHILDEPTEALLHLAVWLIERPAKVVPAVIDGKICFVKGKKIDTEKIMHVAKKNFSLSHLKKFEQDPRMRIEWFFADSSKECGEINPFSRWVFIEDDTLAPFDVSTTCSELFTQSARLQLTDLDENQEVLFASEYKIYMMKNMKFTPVNLCFSGKDDASPLNRQSARPRSIPSLNLEGDEGNSSPRHPEFYDRLSFSPSTDLSSSANRLQGIPLAKKFEDEVSTSPSSDKGRRDALSPRPIDLDAYFDNSDSENSDY